MGGEREKGMPIAEAAGRLAPLPWLAGQTRLEPKGPSDDNSPGGAMVPIGSILTRLPTLGCAGDNYRPCFPRFGVDWL